MKEYKTNEVLMVGVEIFVERTTKVPDIYKGIFHGKTTIPKGRYTYWYPCKNTTYSRMVYQLERWYGMKLKFGVMGTAEI